jgi:hypothetical protein
MLAGPYQGLAEQRAAAMLLAKYSNHSSYKKVKDFE